MSQIDSRIKLKRSTASGTTPSLGPSSNHRDGTWDEYDIYPGEIFVNVPDQRLWVGTETGVNEILLGTTAGQSGSPFEYGSTAGGVDILTSIQPTFGNNEINSNYSSILGGQNNSSGGFDNVHIIGSNITATASDTTYVERLDIGSTSGIVLNSQFFNIEQCPVGAGFERELFTGEDVIEIGMSGKEFMKMTYDQIGPISIPKAVVFGDINQSYIVKSRYGEGNFGEGTAGNYGNTTPSNSASDIPLFINADARSQFVGGLNNTFNTLRGSVIIGGTSQIIATKANTVYMPEIELQSVARFAEFTVATVPTASLHTGGFIMVTDETGGYIPAFSDGTNWRRVTDRAIVS